MHKKISSGAEWESIVGYSRAVVINNQIEIAGTTATENGTTLFIGDPAGQTQWIIEKFKSILESEGTSLNDVVRTRIYVTNIKDWEAIGRVHGTYFKDIRPACTLVEVSGLVSPDMLVEIEATAIKQN